jgi:geranylgeranyl pyrophosphate synthase
MTLPLIYALKAGTPAQVTLIEQTIRSMSGAHSDTGDHSVAKTASECNESTAEQSPQILIELVGIVQTLGATQQARQAAQLVFEDAIRALEFFPTNTPGLSQLHALAEQSIVRTS